MKYYPSYLPLPQIDYAQSNDNRTVRTNFESGRISQKSLATTQRDFISVVFQYSFFELGVWESFVQTSLSNGSLEFTIDLPDPITETVKPTVVLLADGKYETTAVSGKLVWKVTGKLIRQNKVSYTQEELDAFEASNNPICDYDVVVNVEDGIDAMTFTVTNNAANLLIVSAFTGLGTVSGLPIHIPIAGEHTFTVIDPQLDTAVDFTITTQCGESDDITIPAWIP